MAASTCEGATLPEEQAAPEDTATPSRSRAITAVSALMPGTANSVVLGSRSTAGAEDDDRRRDRLEAGFEPVAQRRHGGALLARARSRAAAAAAPKPAIAGHILGAGAGAALLAAAADQRLEVQRLVAPDQRADALGAADLVRQKASEDPPRAH